MAAQCGPDRTSMVEPVARATALSAPFADDDIRRARTRIAQGISNVISNDYVASVEDFETALALLESRGAGDSLDAARALAWLAQSSAELGARAEPLERARHALAIVNAHADTPDDLRVHAHWVTAFMLLETGRFAEAERLIRTALAHADRTIGRNACQALIARSIEGLLLGRQLRLAEADAVFAALIPDAEAALGPQHFWTRAFLGNRSVFLQEAGDIAAAEAATRASIDRIPPGEDPVAPSNTYARTQLTDLFLRAGRFADAARNASDTLTLIESRPNPDPRSLADALISMSYVLRVEQRNAEAAQLLRRARAIHESIGGAGSLPTLSASATLASALMAMGAGDEAEAMLRRDLAAAQTTYGADNATTAYSRIRLATLLRDRAKYAEAVTLFQEALAILRPSLGPDNSSVIDAEFSIAFSLWGQGQQVEAERLMTAQYDRLLQSHGRDHPATLNIASSLAVLRLDLPDRALAAIGPARAMADAISRFRSGNDATNSAVAQAYAPSLTILADAIWARRGVASDKTPILDAFAALQTAISGGPDRAVLRDAARRVADATDPRASALIAERDTILQQLDANRAATNALRAQTDADPAALPTLNSARAELDRRLEGVDAQLGTLVPDYFSLIRPQPLSQAQTQTMLAADEAVLMIVPTERGTHVMALSNNAGTWIRADLSVAQINSSVERLLFDLGAPVEVTLAEATRWQEEGGRGYPFNRRLAWILYTHLFPESVRNILDGKRHVFVATTGSLTSLPLGVLVTEEPQGPDGDAAALRGTSWLADRYALINVPTLQSLWLQRQAAARMRDVRRPTGFVGFGDPLLNGQAAERGGGRGTRGAGTLRVASAFQSGGERGEAARADPDELRRMARLPGTAVELNAMREALGAPRSAVRLGAAATEAALRSTDFSNARIIALATHGLLAGEVSGNAEPGLVFTPPSRADADDDGLLTSSEIAALNLNAEWVILSACNTAAGDGSEGAPGLSGLAQAFFFAGAQTLLASHWPVRDDVAARITVRTIEIQRDTPGLSRAEAFQRAMREIRADTSHDSPTDTWAHPNAWAPFTLIGDGAR